MATRRVRLQRRASPGGSGRSSRGSGDDASSSLTAAAAIAAGATANRAETTAARIVDAGEFAVPWYIPPPQRRSAAVRGVMTSDSQPFSAVRYASMKWIVEQLSEFVGERERKEPLRWF